MPTHLKSLLNIDNGLDSAVRDLAIFTKRYKDIYPAAGGDVSQMLSLKSSRRLQRYFRTHASRWFRYEELSQLASLRRDGRTGYRSENVTDHKILSELSVLANRVMLITSTGSQLPAILDYLQLGMDGRYLNLVEVRNDGKAFRLLYGNREFGTIPSIELHIHLLATALSLREGIETPGVVHAHPYHCVRVGMHPRIRGDFLRFNAVIYSQVEGMNRNVPDLVGVIPYAPSGSEKLVRKTYPLLAKHHVVLWMNHGVTVRSINIERAHSILAYFERASYAASETLATGGIGLPPQTILSLKLGKELITACRKLRLRLADA